MRSCPDNRPRYTLLCLVILLTGLAVPRWAAANGADLPPEIVVQAFVKVEDGHLRLLARFPLLLLSSFSLPKRGPGYLDLAHIDQTLNEAAVATGRQIELFEDGVPLTPTVRDARLSLLSSRAFSDYPTALAHFREPPLPADTELFWNQGFFDTQLEYPLRSPNPHISILTNVAAELGPRLKLKLVYLPIDAPQRSYEIRGGTGRIPLDPNGFEAAWIFVKGGFVDAYAFERLVFLICLIAPFRQARGALAIVLVFCALQALTLTAVAEGALSSTNMAWLPPLVDAVLSAFVVLLAIGNLAAPGLRWRWFVGATVGALVGFGVGHSLADINQFAGAHPFVAVAAFNLGVVLEALVALAVVFLILRLLFASPLGPVVGMVAISAVLGHMAWHWMLDGLHEFDHQLGHAAASGGLSAAIRSVALWWLIPAIAAGVIGYFLPRRFDGHPETSLLGALRDRSREKNSML